MTLRKISNSFHRVAKLVGSKGMDKFDSGSKTAADRLETLAELRLELIELAPNGQNGLDDSVSLNLKQANKLEHAKKSASSGLCNEWLSLSADERKNVAAVLESRQQRTHGQEPSARSILDSAGKVVGIEFSDATAGSKAGPKLRLQDEGKSVSVLIDEGPQPVDMLLKLLDKNYKGSHIYRDQELQKCRR